jgi:hypothetical protein
MLMMRFNRLRTRIRDDRGFTMIFAIMVLLITSLFVAGAFVAVEGDVQQTHSNTAADKAYFAAEAGVQVFLYNINTNSSYWEKCAHPEKVAVPGASEETYSYETLPSTYAKKKSESCVPEKAATIIESGNSATGTFRVKVTGEASNGTAVKPKRTIVATFDHPGFLNYVFLSVYEVEDPSTTGATQANCEKFYPSRSNTECPAIPFIPADKLNGPFHSDDSVALCGNTTFGRTGHSDKIEVKGEFYEWPGLGGCTATPTIHGELFTGAKVEELKPPSTDYELLESAGRTFYGRTIVELEGGVMKVVNKEYPKGETFPFPESGVIYVANESTGTCPKYSPFAGNETYETDGPCGDVYIKGSYSKSLTVGAQNDVIIVGSVTEASTGGANVQPTGVATLGLIAEEFVRVYHPVAKCAGCTDTKTAHTVNGNCNYNNGAEKEGPPEIWNYEKYPAGGKVGWGSTENPVIDAAILSTKHSFIVDHFLCGNKLGTLHVWGAIAQFWRGRVCCATTLEPGSGYTKEYNYDERLKTDQPPSFLSPTSTGGWKIERETE